MPEMIRVRAVEGITFPRQARRVGFVGYVEVEAEEEADHIVAGSRRYRRTEEDSVPDTAYYRRAISQGDIERVKDEPDESPEAEPEVRDGSAEASVQAEPEEANRT